MSEQYNQHEDHVSEGALGEHSYSTQRTQRTPPAIKTSRPEYPPVPRPSPSERPPHTVKRGL